MPVKSLDRRAKMTREILKQSLIELMRDKPIHEISIKKICDTADVNRSTFYHHYDSQYELFNDILNDIGKDISDMVKRQLSGPDWVKGILTEAFTYIEKHRETFLVILSENSGFGVGETLVSYVECFITPNAGSSNELIEYCTQFATAGMTSVVWKWLNKEDRMAATDLANMVAQLISPGISRFSVLPL